MMRNTKDGSIVAAIVSSEKLRGLSIGYVKSLTNPEITDSITAPKIANPHTKLLIKSMEDTPKNVRV
jgi:hypothetical protein